MQDKQDRTERPAGAERDRAGKDEKNQLKRDEVTPTEQDMADKRDGTSETGQNGGGTEWDRTSRPQTGQNRAE